MKRTKNTATMPVLFKCSKNLSTSRRILAMPDCHKCKINGSPTSRCLTCKGPSAERMNHGQRIVSFDTMPPSEIAKLQSPPSIVPESQLADFMRLWLRQPPKTRDLLAQIITAPPRSGSAIARSSGVSHQMVTKRLIKASLASPIFRYALRLRRKAKKMQNGNNNTK